MGEIVISIVIGGSMVLVGLLMRFWLAAEARQNAED